MSTIKHRQAINNNKKRLYLFIIFIKILDLEMVDTKRSFYLQKVL